MKRDREAAAAADIARNTRNSRLGGRDRQGEDQSARSLPLSTPPSTDCRADGASIVPGAVRLRAALQRGMASKVAAAMRKQAELDAKVPPCLATLEARLIRRKGLNAATAACLPLGRGRMRRRTRSGATATPPRASPNCGGWRRCARRRTLRRWDSSRLGSHIPVAAALCAEALRVWLRRSLRRTGRGGARAAAGGV